MFSDSHGSFNGMYETALTLKPDMIIHLGDFRSDGTDLASCFTDAEVHTVKGNCDQGMGREEDILDVQNQKILITHGHRYDVKAGLSEIMARGNQIGADIILFGHTHKQYLRVNEKPYMMNPGSARGDKGSYGLIDIENGEVRMTALSFRQR